jgi:hypothetical protein
VQAAHSEAARIVDTADGEADRRRRECDGYVDAKLSEFEETLTEALRTVSRSRAHLWQGGPPPSRMANGSSAESPWRSGKNGRSGTQGRSGTGMDLID